ncbi:hypothetical protein [Anaerolentibacter hominis]|uniref:hypothetical protein n=1 Tax=Anaerolentibacter hominis TaxID=3079009 RepID=UPI0031B88B5C
MNTLKRTGLFLTRKRVKNILLILCIFFLAFILFLCFSIKRSANETLTDLRQTLGGNILMELNVDTNGLSIDQKFEINSRFNRDLIKQIADTEGIINYNAEGCTGIYTPKLVLAPGSNYNMLADSNSKTEKELIKSLEVSLRKPKVYGEIDTHMVEHFLNGTFTLTEGRHIQKEDVRKVLISETLAKNNNLKIGDFIYFEVNEYITRENGKLDNILASDNMEIVGVFRVNAKQVVNYYTTELEIAKIIFIWI